jgi:hypothetical protein
MSAIIMLVGAVVIMQPVGAAAFNPQPEPPGKEKSTEVKPGEAQSGIAPSPFKPNSTKLKGGSKPGETQMGIAIEDKQGGTAK